MRRNFSDFELCCSPKVRNLGFLFSFVRICLTSPSKQLGVEAKRSKSLRKRQKQQEFTPGEVFVLCVLSIFSRIVWIFWVISKFRFDPIRAFRQKSLFRQDFGQDRLQIAVSPGFWAGSAKIAGNGQDFGNNEKICAGRSFWPIDRFQFVDRFDFSNSIVRIVRSILISNCCIN